MMTEEVTVEQYISKLDPDSRKMAERLRSIIIETAPDVRESIKWSRPVYELNGLLCYIAVSDKHVSLGFYYGFYFDDPDGLLEGSGKLLRHVKLHNDSSPSDVSLKRLIEEAVRIDRSR